MSRDSQGVPARGACALASGAYCCGLVWVLPSGRSARRSLRPRGRGCGSEQGVTSVRRFAARRPLARVRATKAYAGCGSEHCWPEANSAKHQTCRGAGIHLSAHGVALDLMALAEGRRVRGALRPAARAAGASAGHTLQLALPAFP